MDEHALRRLADDFRRIATEARRRECTMTGLLVAACRAAMGEDPLFADFTTAASEAAILVLGEVGVPAWLNHVGMTEVEARADLCGAAVKSAVACAAAAADRPTQTAAPQESGESPQTPDGPDSRAMTFWWGGKAHDATDWQPSVWELCRAVWGEPEIAVPDLVKRLGKPKRTKYDALKHLVSRLNRAMVDAQLPCFWMKKPGKDALLYTGPAPVGGCREVAD